MEALTLENALAQADADIARINMGPVPPLDSPEDDEKDEDRDDD